MEKATADTSEFEPFYVGDVQAGEVHWLAKGVSGIWRALPGQVPEEVPYFFEKPEHLHVLEGTVHITTEDGETVTLKPGDVAWYPAGAASIWRFETPFRKFFVDA